MIRCAECKGNLKCGRKECPLLKKFSFLKSFDIREGELEKPTPPSVFVGRIGYPKVFVGPLIALNPENPEYLDSPWKWSGKVDDVIALRMSLLRGMKTMSVDSAKNPDRFLTNIQEMTASIKPVDLSTEVGRVVRKEVFDDTVQPMGMSARIKALELAENPKIPRRVENLYYDDLSAANAVRYLFDHGFSTYYLQKILSIGMLGYQSRRRIVPTRWSITAIHDILGEQIKREIAEFESLDEVLLFSYEHFGNHFEIIISPGDYSFQLIEIWMRKSFWSPDNVWIGSDSESLARKRGYSPLSGGYYAARLPVLEYLRKIRRKGRILVIREITPEYYAPLGVWVVEEGVRKAMNNPVRFDSFPSAVEVACKRIKTPYNFWKDRIVRSFQVSLENFL
ncbi:hypothetical protein Asulf_00206 [Archaeoglobus sulfaticallidus PM70-1]|uniref:DNA repair protein n=1 Tax=Archaeoglobus sulfaticallidus PM70-1 TaxID=387631 RepID=N0BJ96_9EURY|nr:Nre family DNA repair protein [Archaeoglobus sulfaticallidus]AGK60240.1 hypothetical protein Asulf_00206 [Archaeoglobus sulfaticallidus PM70-1]